MEDQRVFHEINQVDLQEAPEVITALDETIPSPARIQMAETVELPEIQTMTGYMAGAKALIRKLLKRAASFLLRKRW